MMKDPRELNRSSSDRPDSAQFYTIRVTGLLDRGWSEWFGGFSIVEDIGDDNELTTILRGVVADQAELRGVLSRLWDMNLTLVSVTSDASDGIAGG